MKTAIPWIMGILVLILSIWGSMPTKLSAAGTSISVSPATKTISNGETFSVDLILNTDSSTVGWMGGIIFDPTALRCNSITPGDFYAGASSLGEKPIDNTHGTILNLNYVLLGSVKQQTTNGKLLTINFTAIKNDTSTSIGYTTPSMHFAIDELHTTTYPMTVWNQNVQDISGLILNEGLVTIGNPTNPPTITSFSPTSAAAGATITITGTFFTGTTAVKFGGTSVQSFNIVSDTSITAILGNGSTGSVSIITPNGEVTKEGFVFQLPVPSISTFTPALAGQGLQVTITGANFTGATAVKFGNTDAQNFQVSGTNTITATVGNGSSGQVSVTTPGGTATKDGFVFAQTPTISSFTPTSATTAGSIVITGTSFTGATGVTFGGTAAQSFTVNSATQITAIVGSGTSGAVRVSTPGGTIAKDGFTFIPPTTTPVLPTIVSFTPLSAGTGSRVTITGTNFTGVTAVKFGGADANDFTVNSATEIVATLGNGASGDISVTTSGGTANKSGFSFITAASPTPSTSITASPTTSYTPSSIPTTKPSTVIIKTTVPAKTTSQPTSTPKAKSNTTSKLTSSSQVKSANTVELFNSIGPGGILQENVRYRDINIGGKIRVADLAIKSGTRALSINGEPLEAVNVIQSLSPVAPPSGSVIVNAFEFEPSGATFSIPLDIIIEYDPSQIPDTAREDSLLLAYYDVQEGKWVDCDYILDTVNHRINVKISHFSLYAILGRENAGVLGIGWSLAGTIILAEIILAGLAIYLISRRRKPLIPALTGATSEKTHASNPIEVGLPVQTHNERPVTARSSREEAAQEILNEIFPRNSKSGTPCKTHVEIIGGKLVIPREGKSADVELVNMPDSRIIVSLEYDPDLHPQGCAKIVILGATSEYEKSKETRK